MHCVDYRLQKSTRQRERTEKKDSVIDGAMRREGSPPWPQGNLLSRSAGRYSAAPGPAKAPGLNAGPQMGSSRDDFYPGQNRDPHCQGFKIYS